METGPRNCYQLGMRQALKAMIALPLLLQAGDNGSRVHYMGGTVAGIPNNCEVQVDVHGKDAMEVRFLPRSRRQLVNVPYSSIETLEYGMKVDRRYIEAVLISPLFLLAKRRAHFLTVGYMEGGHREVIVFQVDKGDIRALLVSLEARTGKRVEYQDEEARRAGKG